MQWIQNKLIWTSVCVWVYMACWRCRCRCFGVIVSHRQWRCAVVVLQVCVCVSVSACLSVCACVSEWVSKRKKKESQDCVCWWRIHRAYDRISRVCISARFSSLLYIVVGDTPLYPQCVWKRWFSRFQFSFVFLCVSSSRSYLVYDIEHFEFDCVCIDAFVCSFLWLFSAIKLK